MGFRGHISDSIHNLIHSNCGQLFSPPFAAGTGLATDSDTDNGPQRGRTRFVPNCCRVPVARKCRWCFEAFGCRRRGWLIESVMIVNMHSN